MKNPREGGVKSPRGGLVRSLLFSLPFPFGNIDSGFRAAKNIGFRKIPLADRGGPFRVLKKEDR
jgi:hypothetical protein